jgi:hypothetical protein
MSMGGYRATAQRGQGPLLMDCATVVVDFWRLARVGRHLPLGRYGDMGPSLALHDWGNRLGRRADDDHGDLHLARAGIRRRHTSSVLP